MAQSSARHNGLYATAMADVTLRPARQVRADGEEFARYFDIAGDGVLRWMLGKRFVAIVSEAFVEPGHDMSYQHAWFAEHDGAIVGLVSGYSAAEHQRAKNGPLFRAAGVGAVRPFAAWLLARGFFSFMDRVPEGDWYLQAIAVDPASRGFGIGSILFDHAERIAAEGNARRLALDVAIDNDRARSLYESRGMSVTATSPSIPFVDRSAVHRMAKAL